MVARIIVVPQVGKIEISDVTHWLGKFRLSAITFTPESTIRAIPF